MSTSTAIGIKIALSGIVVKKIFGSRTDATEEESIIVILQAST